MLICGIEEAGRGPVIGPMVICGVLIEDKDEKKLKKIEVKDSKLLTPKQRTNLYDKIIKVVKNHKLIILQPKKIDEALFSDSLNLNWLTAENMVKIINKLKPDTAIIDCPSPNIKAFKNYLMERLDNKKTQLIVEHKADVNHLIVGAASILAKVTRDMEIEKIKKKIGDFGSGYPADPKTVEFLKNNFHKYPGIFRKSWMSFKTVVNNKNQKKLKEF